MAWYRMLKFGRCFTYERADGRHRGWCVTNNTPFLAFTSASAMAEPFTVTPPVSPPTSTSIGLPDTAVSVPVRMSLACIRLGTMCD